MHTYYGSVYTINFRSWWTIKPLVSWLNRMEKGIVEILLEHLWLLLVILISFYPFQINLIFPHVHIPWKWCSAGLGHVYEEHMSSTGPSEVIYLRGAISNQEYFPERPSILANGLLGGVNSAPSHPPVPTALLWIGCRGAQQQQSRVFLYIRRC